MGHIVFHKSECGVQYMSFQIYIFTLFFQIGRHILFKYNYDIVRLLLLEMKFQMILLEKSYETENKLLCTHSK